MFPILIQKLIQIYRQYQQAVFKEQNVIYESQIPHQIQQQPMGIESAYLIMQGLNGINLHHQQLQQNNAGFQRIVLANSSPQEKVNQMPQLVKFPGGRLVVVNTNQVRTFQLRMISVIIYSSFV
jgi:hypothetical protein